MLCSMSGSGSTTLCLLNIYYGLTSSYVDYLILFLKQAFGVSNEEAE